MIRNIESFHGALSASYELTKDPPDFEKVIEILMEPKGFKGGIVSLLGENSIPEKAICRMLCIPPFSSFKPSVSERLKEIFRDFFTRFVFLGSASLRYWKLFQSVRHVYAHNYRFIFYDNVLPGQRPRIDESIIGFINPPEPTEHESVYIGGIQRIAMGELTFRINRLEQWVYQNMRMCSKNGGKPILPRTVGFLKDEHLKEYEKIWKLQKYDFPDPKQSTKMEANVGDQISLHMNFLKKLDEWGIKISLINQEGVEEVVSFDKLHSRYSLDNADDKAKAAIERMRSKRRPKKGQKGRRRK